TVAATGAGVAGSGVAAGAVLTTTGAAVATAVTAGITSLASTAAVSLINNKGDLGATLKELGSEDNAKGLLLTMATAGLTNGILNQVGLSGVDANSTVGQLFARNAIQGITSAVLESAVMGTNLEDALKNNLKGALINTVAAQGADEIGDAKLDATSKALAHALLGCAMGAATAGSSAGCAPGATGAVIGEIVAGLYGDSQDLGGLEEKLKNDPNNAALKQQIAQIQNTVTELAKLTGAGGALLIGGDAETMQIAMGTAQNAAVNNYLNHAELKLRDQARQACDAGNPNACQTVKSLDQLSASRNATIRSGVTSATEAQAGEILQNMQTTMQGLTGYRGELQTQLDATSDPSLRASLQARINEVDNNMKQVAGLGKDYLAQQYQNTGNPLYQSAFAQLSAATSGNDLADAMASVMGVQLARLPTRTPSTNPSAATVASQSSIDLAAIQRVRVENNASADANAAGGSPTPPRDGVNGRVVNLAETQATLTTQIADLRATLTGNAKTGGNMGVAQIDIPGIQPTMAASSQINVPSAAQAESGFVGKVQETFPSSVVPTGGAEPFPLLRDVDSEAKILNNVAAQLGDNTAVTGTINLLTERAPCASCSNVIDQFKAKYPNVTVNVFDNNGKIILPTKKGP
ncbi:DUF637 domain-containing protein, partial [Hydrogenophaga aromaticivorans]|uniref:DUF637 domain-containing protein n=1 Tax=Hydrogenophaga aromaticivorans TaxID=2610898 RepID=UPI001B384113